MARFNTGDVVRLDVTFLPVMEGVVVDVKPSPNAKASLAIYIVEFEGDVRLELNAGQIVRLTPDAKGHAFGRNSYSTRQFRRCPFRRNPISYPLETL